MLRALAWGLVVWGVAVWATWGYYLLLGIAPAEKMLSAGIGGGLLVAVGYWLENRTRRKPTDPPDGKAQSTPPTKLS
jgi:hypothetical protein